MLFTNLADKRRRGHDGSELGMRLATCAMGTCFVPRVTHVHEEQTLRKRGGQNSESNTDRRRFRLCATNSGLCSPPLIFYCSSCSGHEPPPRVKRFPDKHVPALLHLLLRRCGSGCQAGGRDGCHGDRMGISSWRGNWVAETIPCLQGMPCRAVLQNGEHRRRAPACDKDRNMFGRPCRGQLHLQTGIFALALIYGCTRGSGSEVMEASCLDIQLRQSPLSPRVKKKRAVKMCQV